MSTRLALASAALVALVLAGACSTPADPRYVETPPDSTTFAPVAQVLVHHCGSLDCHGIAERNLRIYGNEGLRFDPADSPLRPTTTTDREVAEDYLSAIALEPELTSAVVAQGGAHPERLTLVRKARGQEAHKGGSPIREGDDSDTCLTSWLAGKTDVAACGRAVPTLPP